MRLDRLRVYTWGVVGVVGVSLACAVFQIAFVRPFLWPAGTGAAIAGDPSAAVPLVARPPNVVADPERQATVLRVAAESPAATASVRPGDVVLSQERTGFGTAHLSPGPTPAAHQRLSVWRDMYRQGVQGDIAWRIQPVGRGERTVQVRRVGVWSSTNRTVWARRHVGTVLQVVVYAACAVVLLVLRNNAATAGLLAVALSLCAVAGGGPLLGAEHAIPFGAGFLLTILAWLAVPLAFTVVALAILHFPARSPLLVRHPALHLVPLLTAAPMLVPGLGTALYLSGVDAAHDVVLWDAAHPAVYDVSFTAALFVTVAAFLERMYRYSLVDDSNKRRRITVAVFAVVPAAAAYLVKDGVPVIAGLAGVALPEYPAMVLVILQGLVLMAPVGLVYAVRGMARDETSSGEPVSSLPTQKGPLFDVAGLRHATATPGRTSPRESAAFAPVWECPRCGRCEESGREPCPADGSPMRAVPSVPSLVDNTYRIEQLIGRGGMGAVYRARDMRHDRLVALKVVGRELLGDTEARRRFLVEAQIVARLQHPSIVSVFDHGTFPEGGGYLVMELVPGEDLRRVLQREGHLEPRRAIQILVNVCAAVEAAHREGILHRDLKPENILLAGEEQVPKVLDFGLAKVMSDRADAAAGRPATAVTAAGTIVGTPPYMAPEQFRGAAPNARTDVFSLGVIAYEMLTGELPFGRGSVAQVVLAQAHGVRPMPGKVTAALDRAVRTALEAEPDQRPASPRAFAHLLSAAEGM